ncbi:phytase [Ideonella margarita]|uniref:Phytase n=1 Tax=Ideonella margarita TaxID=2984191 RepID=A0ABU9C7A3_9BURK
MTMSIKKIAALALATVLASPALADSLSLGKQGLRLLGEQGQVLDEVQLRAKRWDQRLLADGAPLALLHDADSGELLLLQAAAGRLRTVARWPGPEFNLEALCLYRDPQQLLQVFLLGDEGLGEQWLLAETAPQLKPLKQARAMRQLAAAPGVKACAVRDESAELLYVEPGVGLWAGATNPERAGRHLLAPAPITLEAGLAAHPAVAAPALPRAVLPVVQTEPVRGQGDAADDPAIWVHPTQPARSLVLGTDKKRGLVVYDLQGHERQFLPVGRVNNVDLRQGLRWVDWRGDLAVATHRDENSVVLFEVQRSGRVQVLAHLPTTLTDIYGLCSGRNPQGGLDIFVNDKDGHFQQLRLQRPAGQWRSETVAAVKLESQPEGCVADERGRQVFIGEEKRGIWRLGTDEQGRMSAPQMVLPVGGLLTADVEGMAIHNGPQGRRLVVSSQGSDSYVVLNADAPHAVIGDFRIGVNAAAGIDAVSETDGLDVVSANLGGAFSEGLLVVQDGHKRWPTTRQNFKLVPWKAVREALGQPRVAGAK